jgi:pimeloyl-ACP methyl ester carboxylesterase
MLRPKHVFLIGSSEGGLVATLSAEQLPQVYTSAGAACGPIGSFQAQINYLDDFRVVFNYFFPGVIPGTAIDIPAEVIADWNAVYVPAITAALSANPQAAAQLIHVLNAAVTSDPATIPKTVLDVLFYNVFGTADAVATLGGQPFDNHDRIYLGSSNDFLLNQKVERYTASPAARAAIAARYETSGQLKMPIVTLHTTEDPVVPYWHEALYTFKTLAAGTFSQRINLPVSNYGHCAFSAGDILAAFKVMLLQDLGSDITSQVQAALPEPHLAEFNAALRRNESALRQK